MTDMLRVKEEGEMLEDVEGVKEKRVRQLDMLCQNAKLFGTDRFLVHEK